MSDITYNALTTPDELRRIIDRLRAANDRQCATILGSDEEIERLRTLLRGVEIALARDESIDAAMRLINRAAINSGDHRD